MRQERSETDAGDDKLRPACVTKIAWSTAVHGSAWCMPTDRVSGWWIASPSPRNDAHRGLPPPCDGHVDCDKHSWYLSQLRQVTCRMASHGGNPGRFKTPNRRPGDAFRLFSVTLQSQGTGSASFFARATPRTTSALFFAACSEWVVWIWIANAVAVEYSTGE
ncbi:hypothetical protein BDY17DRAFT_298778 [Neohortaea acidophila]|uniref:Uncharacterized protein n=1 Tax=Neohortaea acidophila TaxID=245834 RepID=A0A6A6PSE8_9PEZI|nr:uncharacterized protein BDY17DRAFT_298778 [Neohortaea acidophila]KAF2482594.1 hypothetical protein BDY17DRAFT_298778 [Neohortaea acidophila]